LAKKQTIEIKDTVDLVADLPESDRKALFSYKIKATTATCKLSISSTQAEIRAAELRSTGLKQVHAGGQILKGYVKAGLAKIQAGKSDKERQVHIKELAAQIEKVTKGTAAACQAAMAAHWKTIEKAEADAEKAVALAEELARKDAKAAAKNQPKLSTTDWFKLVLKALSTKTAVAKAITEFQNTRKSLLLTANALATEALRVGGEAGKGTPPAVIQKQRQLLMDGHLKQFALHLGNLKTQSTQLLNNLEGVLNIAKKIDENAASAHVKVRELQFELNKIDEFIEKVKPAVSGFKDKAGTLLEKAASMALGKVPATKAFATDLGTQLDLDESFTRLLACMTAAGKTVTVIAKL
jgi:hypothetical protein